MASKLVRGLAKVAGTVVVLIGMCLGGALLYWNVWGQGPYRDSCHMTLGCRSFACLHRALAGNDQVEAPGMCTKSCDRDDDCGAGARCVVLGDDARGDLPPFGKPDKACMPFAGAK